MTKSNVLKEHFVKNLLKIWVDKIRDELTKIEKDISPEFILQFLKYKQGLLEMVLEPSNASTINDPRVSRAIERWNKKIAEVFSNEYWRNRVRNEIINVSI